MQKGYSDYNTDLSLCKPNEKGILKMSIAEEMIVKLLKMSMNLSLEELESLRSLWIKEVKGIEQSEELQSSCNKFMDLVIQFKREILEGEYAENSSSVS